MMVMNTQGNLDWLLEGDAVLQHLINRDLLDDEPDDVAALQDPRLQRIVKEVSSWPWPAITGHKTADHPLHKFAFLADLGIDVEKALGPDLLASLEGTLVNGLPRLPTKTPERFGGSGRTELAWSLCDTPLLLYSLSKCYPSFDGKEGLRTLSTMNRENGMPCVVSPELGKFRGPGRKDDPCPLANLYTLKAITQIDLEGHEGMAKVITDELLTLWQASRERHPYMFYMGTDFRKLKLPFVWYDVLSVTEALSHCPWAHRDPRFLNMLAVIDSKRIDDRRFKAESIWTAWKDWDFGQKKEPSRWVTFTVERLDRRVGKGE